MFHIWVGKKHIYYVGKDKYLSTKISKLNTFLHIRVNILTEEMVKQDSFDYRVVFLT